MRSRRQAVAGQERLARSRLRDAVILAVGAEAHFRNQEFCYIGVDPISIFVVVGFEEAELFMAAGYCKNRRGRIGIVSDPAALCLLRRLIGERKDGPLFPTSTGAESHLVASVKGISNRPDQIAL